MRPGQHGVHEPPQDPVLLHDTGHSYERKALEEWWTSGHHFCPRTGMMPGDEVLTTTIIPEKRLSLGHHVCRVYWSYVLHIGDCSLFNIIPYRLA